MSGGILGAQTVLRAPADGYTVMGIPGPTYLIAPQLSKTLPFDPIRDFVAVAKVGYVPMILVTSAQSQYKTMKDLISDMKRINSLFCSIAYPILDEAGVLAPSRLRERIDQAVDATMASSAPSQSSSASMMGPMGTPSQMPAK